jgi:hypothetical protein
MPRRDPAIPAELMARATVVRIKLPERVVALPPTVPVAMNQTEARWANVLEGRRLAGTIRSWRYEAKKLILSVAADCSYLPDFWVENLHGEVEIYEVKGAYTREDSIIKLKWAADKYRLITFHLCQWKRGKWSVKVIEHD